jgi:phosphatidylserine/phosphatidylglycerophosphate/cardiolipin synthase-like enzyme
MKIFLTLILLLYPLFAEIHLYLHIPSKLPSKQLNTSFGHELLNLINKAQDSIYFAIYGLRGQDDILKALIRAKKRGVIIKGIVDSDSHNKNYYSDTKLLYKYFKVKSDHQSYIMHNKFFIIDKKILWTGSSNISDTGTGGYNANNAVIINDLTIVSLYLKEFNQMFNNELFHIHKKKLTQEKIKLSNSIVSVYFSPKSNTYYNGIKTLIQNAQQYIYIPIFYLTHKDLANTLLNARKRGVDIKIILDATAARNKYSMHKFLRKNGIKIKVENFGGKMHCKSMIIDDQYFITGSMNFTKAGNIKNDENTLIIQNTKLAKQYKKYFIKLWEQIPNKYLYKDPNPESLASGMSCYDQIDNDFDKKIDNNDNMCKKGLF